MVGGWRWKVSLIGADTLREVSSTWRCVVRFQGRNCPSFRPVDVRYLAVRAIRTLNSEPSPPQTGEHGARKSRCKTLTPRQPEMTTQRPLTIFFSVGEPSGDVHGANLIREIGRQCDHFEAVGYGGPEMAKAGCRLHADLTALAVMWFARALLNLHKFWDLASRADRFFRHHRPDAVVLIDYPGFNWWIAPTRQSPWDSGLLLHAAADLVLGPMAGEQDATFSSTMYCAAFRSRSSGFAIAAAMPHSWAIRSSTRSSASRWTRSSCNNSVASRGRWSPSCPARGRRRWFTT